MEKGNSLKQEAIRGVKCIEPTTSVDHYDGVSNWFRHEVVHMKFACLEVFEEPREWEEGRKDKQGMN